jgi:hypothetical protein
LLAYTGIGYSEDTDNECDDAGLKTYSAYYLHESREEQGNRGERPE